MTFVSSLCSRRRFVAHSFRTIVTRFSFIRRVFYHFRRCPPAPCGDVYTTSSDWTVHEEQFHRRPFFFLR